MRRIAAVVKQQIGKPRERDVLVYASGRNRPAGKCATLSVTATVIAEIEFYEIG